MEKPQTIVKQLFSGFMWIFWLILAGVFVATLIAVLLGRAHEFGVGSGRGVLIFCPALAAFAWACAFTHTEARRSRGLPPFWPWAK